MRNLFCNFFNFVGHEEKDCCAFYLMREHTTDEYRVQGEESKGGDLHYNTPRGYNHGGRGGFKGHRRGGFNRESGLIIYYNCNQQGHLA
jgi:hypothetical protein